MITCIWDVPEDPDGNIQHIAEHDVSVEEVEEVVNNRRNNTIRGHSSGFPLTFGWTSSGKHTAVIWELVEDDPRRIRPITAYPTPPPRRRSR